MKSTNLMSAIVLVLYASAGLCGAENPLDPGLWNGALGTFCSPLVPFTQPQTGSIDDSAAVPTAFDTVRAGRPNTEPEQDRTVKTVIVRSAAATLAVLDEASRSNALIQLEPIGAASTAWPLPDATEIASWWNDGQYKRALIALEQLEAEGVHFAPAISWREPIVSNQKYWYQDVRIGGSRTDANDVIIDYHSGEGTIFAAVSWADGWSVNISTDLGASWQETYWYASGAARIGMTVAGNYVWVAYSPDIDQGEARMRRFFAATGAVDDPYWFNVIADVGPAVITDMELGSNHDDFQNRVFPVFITDTEDLYFYWADLAGTAFNEMSPPVVNANTGLDFTWNTHDASGYSVFISYVNNVDNVIVWRADLFGDWDPVTFTPFTGGIYRTGISAHTGTVMVAFNYTYTEGPGVRYRVSYDNGNAWSNGSLYVPLAGEPAGWGADVSLRSGLGSVGIYNREEGDIDHAYVRSRRGYSSGEWEDPLSFSNFDLISGSLTQVEWIGVSCVGSHGMVYLGEDLIPFFDLMGPRAFFCDGFEAGNTSAWD